MTKKVFDQAGREVTQAMLDRCALRLMDQVHDISRETAIGIVEMLLEEMRAFSVEPAKHANGCANHYLIEHGSYGHSMIDDDGTVYSGNITARPVRPR